MRWNAVAWAAVARSLLAGALAALGCQGGAVDSESGGQPSAVAGVFGALAGEWPVVTGPLVLEPEELLLDVSGGRHLLAKVLPAPSHADPPLRMTVRYTIRGVLQPWPFEGQVIERARLLADGTLAVLTAERLLLVVCPTTGNIQTIDRDVEGPVGASTDGRYLVYAKGEPPELGIVWHDRTAGETRTIADAMAPTWSPGVSEDGTTVYFVSAHTGVPAWWRCRQFGAPSQLTNVGVITSVGSPPELTPFAEALGPTRVHGDWILFEGRSGAYAMRGSGHIAWSRAEAALPHWIEPGTRVGVVVGTPPRVEAVDLPTLPRSIP